MAETTEKTKKAKAPAKPRATAGTAKKAPAKKSAEPGVAAPPTHEEIARLAHKFWAERGHHNGHDEQDWLRAERELKRVAS